MSSTSPGPAVSSQSLIRATLPYVRVAILSRRTALATLLMISIALGLVPTLKSELEAGVFDQINRDIRTKPSLRQALFEPLERFEETGRVLSTTGLVERFARKLFSQISLVEGLGFYLFIGALGFGLDVLSTRASTEISVEMFRCLRLEGFRRGLGGEGAESHHMLNVPGQFTSAIQQGASNVSKTYTYLLEAAQESVSVVTVIVLLVNRNAWFCVSCLILVFGQVAISLGQARRLKTERKSLDKHRNDLAARTDDILTKREIILAWEQHEKYAAKLDGLAAEYAQVERRLQIREAIYGNAASLLTDYGRIFVLVFALVFTLTVSRSSLDSIGDVYFLVSLYVRLFVPINNLLDRYDDVRRSEATSQTYLELLKEPVAAPPPEHQTAYQLKGVEVKTDSLKFVYNRGDETKGLHNCSFTVPRGSVSLLLGPSGCGKTTIARLLLGFMKPQEGRIFIDGKDATNLSGPALRILMSYVSQGDYVIDDKVRENLSWGPEPVSDTDMANALIALRIVDKDKAVSLLDCPAGTLSIGQQQRLSLCRVLLDRAPFLILDEPLTGVDLFTVRDVMPPLIASITGTSRTVLLISHRVGFVSQADHVIIMNERGEVVEEGVPTALLADKKSKLWALYETALFELGGPISVSPREGAQ